MVNNLNTTYSMNHYVAFGKNELGNIYLYIFHKSIFIFNNMRNKFFKALYYFTSIKLKYLNIYKYAENNYIV